MFFKITSLSYSLSAIFLAFLPINCNISLLSETAREKLPATCLVGQEANHDWAWIAGSAAALITGIAIGNRDSGGSDHHSSPPAPPDDDGGDVIPPDDGGGDVIPPDDDGGGDGIRMKHILPLH